MEQFKVIIVEDVQLELKGTEQIFHNDIPEATIIGTASNEAELWKLMRSEVPDLVLLDLGLGGSTTAGVDICRQLRDRYPSLKILIFNFPKIDLAHFKSSGSSRVKRSITLITWVLPCWRTRVRSVP